MSASVILFAFVDNRQIELSTPVSWMKIQRKKFQANNI